MALIWLGGFLGIAVIASLSDVTHLPLLITSFGSSCVLIFCYPDSPLSQPRNVVVGYLVTTAVGLVISHTLGTSWWAMALAVATSITAMQITRTIHPPAGANPLTVMLDHASWSFLLTPTLAGVVALQVVALAYHAWISRHAYPKYWL